jgi:hypothetical protein
MKPSKGKVDGLIFYYSYGLCHIDVRGADKNRRFFLKLAKMCTESGTFALFD